MKTRIVKETLNDGTELFYVEDAVSHMFGIFKTWSRPRNYGYHEFKNMNYHSSLESAKKWIEDRNEWIKATNESHYNRQIRSSEVIK